ncbi:MAG: PKD domain-containing protein [Desulfobulbus sp.]|nr:PKD domain-containing protein [Desulfobulbus sp.]
MFTFTWESTADSSTLTGYRIYLNNETLLCETDDPAATSLACRADLATGTMTFGLAAVYTDGTQSSPSNLLTYTPAEFVDAGRHLFTFNWETTTDPAALAGYQIYLNNTLLCATDDPTATSLACRANLVTGTMTFGLTAVYPDGTQSSPSNLLTYTFIGEASTTDPTTPTNNSALSAVIAAAPLNGTAPLAVSLSSASPAGTITSAQRDFGDGTTTTGTTANSQGLTSTPTTAVQVAASPVSGPEPTPTNSLTAVISTSTAAGAAPLQVSFDGSGSKVTNGTSASYSWGFGDGSSGTGATAAHSYTAAGTYTATLTVTDDQGLASSVSTPIVVTAPVVVANKPPTAAATATPTNGTAPLTVSFDAAGSIDSDGSISSYLWTFGDGSTATGKTASHTYTTVADYTASLTVTDDQGATGTTTIAIKVEAAASLASLNIETGEVGVGSDWVRVPLEGTFTEPVVIAGPPSVNNREPCVIRLRKVSPTGFEIRLAEWDYLDGKHPLETVSYLVMDKGRTTLPDGTMIEAGSFSGTAANQDVRFNGLFNTVPVVLTTVASENELDTISSRVSKISTSRFSHYFKEQEKNKNRHVKETINYIAWEPGQGTIDTLRYEVALAAKGLADGWSIVLFQQPFAQAPFLLADMQSNNNNDTAALRSRAITPTYVPLKVEEKQSKDTETSHPEEKVGYMAFDQTE